MHLPHPSARPSRRTVRPSEAVGRLGRMRAAEQRDRWATLSVRTAEGAVARVDVRCPPYGTARLASSLRWSWPGVAGWAVVTVEGDHARCAVYGMRRWAPMPVPLATVLVLARHGMPVLIRISGA
ncbi:MAG: hypothetical protein ACRDN9_10395 [Streptosporangiaceae bacterium]